jgi:hypothetical protein
VAPLDLVHTRVLEYLITGTYSCRYLGTKFSTAVAKFRNTYTCTTKFRNTAVAGTTVLNLVGTWALFD